jgi:hypothetical protein
LNFLNSLVLSLVNGEVKRNVLMPNLMPRRLRRRGSVSKGNSSDVCSGPASGDLFHHPAL